MISHLLLLLLLLLSSSPTASAAPSWIVSIGYSTASSTHCTGTLLNKEWLVTTAECVRRESESNDLRVFAGCSAGSTTNCTSVHHVASTYLHPCFRASSPGSSDVALVRLMAPGVVTGSSTRFPVLPPSGVSEYTGVGETAVAYGWGATPGAPMRSATLPFLAPSTCRAKFLELDGTYSTEMKFQEPRRTVLCAGSSHGGTDVPCEGFTDSGAPLLQAGMNGAADVLVGVWTLHTPAPPSRIPSLVNSGLTCSAPGVFHVYTRTTYYTKWLSSVMSTKEIGTCASATVSAANGTLALIPSSSSNTIPVGIRYPWGDCPPSKRFVGANIADATFLQKFGDASLKNDRGETFEIFDQEYDDGFPTTSPVGTFPPIDTHRVSTAHQTYDMAGNVREWTADVFVDDVYSKRASFNIDSGVIASNPLVSTHPVEGCHGSSCMRVIRGGSWADTCCHQPNAPNAARDVLSTTRSFSYQKGADDRTGFRIVCVAPSTLGSSTSESSTPLPYVSGDDVSAKGWSIHASNLRRVPSGVFTMGTDDVSTGGGPSSRPAHRVLIDEMFIGSREVTVSEYRAFVEDTKRESVSECTSSLSVVVSIDERTGKTLTRPETNVTWSNPGFLQGDDHPVVCVTWDDAMEFTTWMTNKKLGGGSGWSCSLPTEAQWEKAARGNTRRGVNKCDQEFYDTAELTRSSSASVVAGSTSAAATAPATSSTPTITLDIVGPTRLITVQEGSSVVLLGITASLASLAPHPPPPHPTPTPPMIDE